MGVGAERHAVLPVLSRVREPVQTPTAAAVDAAAVTRFGRALGFDDHESLRAWSAAEPAAFWGAVWSWFDVLADGDSGLVLASEAMPGARWFPGVALSYAEHVFRDRDPEALALQHASEGRSLRAWTWAQLHEETARVRAGLRRMGVGRGDRVAAYLPNTGETVAAFLATASLGAVWTSCSPDFGADTVVDRFEQVEPVVLLATDGYRYRGRTHDRATVVADLAAQLPTVRRVVTLGQLGTGDWDLSFPTTSEPLIFDRVPFDHPLWVLYSSGTTGRPKAIVQGHGGILLEHLKTFAFHIDVTSADRVFWFTTTGWMMWNLLVSGLLTEASVVLYDGDPSGGRLWDLAEATGITVLGIGAAFIHGALKAQENPAATRDLSTVRAVGSTGSPLSIEGERWVRRALGGDVWVFAISGGTDVCTAFVGGSPVLPSYEGEMQTRCLGAAVEAWDDHGEPVLGAVGELVITRPMPSMPTGFWDDPDDVRYRDAYFSTYPGVWRHGDWVRITSRGGVVIEGRSDATINRGGVRMGTAELYAAVLALDEVADALVVDLPPADGTNDSTLALFVVCSDGVGLDNDLRTRIADRLRTVCSPRHVPDAIVQLDTVPRTLTGKVLEVPAKRVLMGADPATVATPGAMASPAALLWFARHGRAAVAAALAARRTG